MGVGARRGSCRSIAVRGGGGGGGGFVVVVGVLKGGCAGAGRRFGVCGRVGGVFWVWSGSCPLLFFFGVSFCFGKGYGMIVTICVCVCNLRILDLPAVFVVYVCKISFWEKKRRKIRRWAIRGERERG